MITNYPMNRNVTTWLLNHGFWHSAAHWKWYLPLSSLLLLQVINTKAPRLTFLMPFASFYIFLVRDMPVLQDIRQA